MREKQHRLPSDRNVSPLGIASMIDYSKLKVTELKVELKSRNLPLTGLKVKQNFIDKLLEADAADEASNSPADIAPAGIKSASATNPELQDEENSVVGPEKAGASQENDSLSIGQCRKSLKSLVLNRELQQQSRMSSPRILRLRTRYRRLYLVRNLQIRS